MQYRLSARAEGDIARILATSQERWGESGRQRYAAAIVAAIRMAAANPEGHATQSRGELAPGIRSLHLRHARPAARTATVKRPVHVLYFRVAATDLLEIVRVLHERMEPRRHLSKADGPG